MNNKYTIREQHSLNTLTSAELEYIYSQSLFKLFIPRALGGLALDLPDALERIFEAGERDGSVGWCVNLGAGAGYFAGFFDASTAKTIYGSDKSVVAGSGSHTGNAILEKGIVKVNGHWEKCTGSAHATYFTVNATDPNNNLRSYAIPRALVKIEPSWNLFALKKTSSDAIRVENAHITEDFVFDMGVIKNEHAYLIHRLDFMPFARYCMAAAYFGMVSCFVESVAPFSGYADALRASMASGWHRLICSALRTWNTLEAGNPVSDVEGLQEQISTDAKEMFDLVNAIFYQHGMRLSNENNLAHYRYRDVLLGSQHFLLK